MTAARCSTRWGQKPVISTVRVTPPLKTNMTIRKSPFLIGDTSLDGWFLSIVMLVFGGDNSIYNW